MADYERALGENVTIYVNVHNVTTGNVSSADANPTFRVYEEEVTAPILTGSMTAHNVSSVTGFYSKTFAVTTNNGFAYGRTYCIRKEALVASVTAAKEDTLTIVGTLNVDTATGNLNGLTSTALAQINAEVDTAVAGLATSVQATAIEADTQDIQSRLPAALGVGGWMKTQVLAVGTTTLTASGTGGQRYGA